MEKGSFRKIHFLEILEDLEILEILEIPQTVENKGESDHFLEILENLEILEILEIPPVKDPFRNDSFFGSRISVTEITPPLETRKRKVGCPGNFALRVFKEFVQKKVRAHFSFPTFQIWLNSAFISHKFLVGG